MPDVSTPVLTTPKAFLTGTHRTRHPEETWSVVAPHLAAFGITRVADVTGLDLLGIPVAMAVRPLAKMVSVSQGKGQSLLLAKVSAVMEGIELWHAEYAHPPVTHRRIPAAELDLSCHIEEVTTRPSLLTGTTPLDWVDAVGLSSGRRMPLPIDLVCFTAPDEETWRPAGLWPTSNGLASGNCLPEAALHALYEVIERDAISQQVPGAPERYVDLDSVDNAACAQMVQQIRRAGATLLVTQLPNRFGVPCFGAQVWSPDFPVITLGWGAHLAADIAVSRAITEAAQSRLTAIVGSRDDLPPVYDYAKHGANEPPPAPTELFPWAECATTGQNAFADLTEELSWLCGTVRTVLGAEPLMVDLSTRADFSVVKVIVPRTSLDMTRVHPTGEERPPAM
ncbi:MAG TPA: YcaO-like family protein [Jatrophihabitans sp.]|nr:YcaO-like family protein [Jatrophihabitans sp.]